MFRFATPEEAAGALTAWVAAGDPDTGHSYAWDRMVLTGESLLRVHGGCVFAAANFARVEAALARALTEAGAAPAASARCRCGGGCALSER